MKDEKKTKAQLIEELTALRKRVAALEAFKQKETRVEKKLRENEEKFRLISEQSMLGIFIVQDNRIKYTNQAMSRIYGYSVEETLAWSPGEFAKTIHPEDRDYVVEQAKRKQAGESGQEKNYTFRIITKTGEVKEVEIYSTTVLYEGREADLATMIDITERRRMEEKLRESEEKFRLISEQSMLGIIIIQDFTIKYINQVAADIHEYSVEEMLRMGAEEFAATIYEEDRELVLGHIARHQRGENETTAHETVRIFTPSGKCKWVEIFAKSIIFQGKTADLVTITDVTERKRAEEKLRESEETLRVLLHSIDETAILVDPEGKVLIINETGARRLGMQVSGVVGKDIFHLLPPSVAARRLTRFKQALQTGKPVYFADHRSNMYLENSIIPILDSENEVSRLAIFAKDVTDHVRLEEALLARSQELESFAHTISHDLRTPLTLINGYAQTARNAMEERSPEVEKEALQGILKATRRLDGFIDALLKYAQAGQTEGKAERVDPGKIIGDVLEEQSEMIHSIAACVEVERELPQVWVDPIRFHQVMANLLENALKFMGENPHPYVEIGATREGDVVTWFVRDNGVGIHAELLKDIFQPFKRFSAASSPGLGIGLATVKRLVEAWGGEAWAESTHGEGSTFFFTTPA
jgi:PAS domain S-box-containing protein